MMKMLLTGLIVSIFFVCCERRPPSSDFKSEPLQIPKVTIEKEKIERDEALPPEVKIKLKRDGKDNYSWEVSGSDVDQVLKVNEKLKKRLGGEQSK